VDPYSHAFKSFVEAHAVGSILDIGCGQFERPIYLSGFPKSVIYGLDPLPAQTEFDFPVARGIGEYLPWEDASFDTLISATAIDHTLSLDRALAEMERVLAADGRILMWVGSVPGAKRYEPEAPEYAPADKFHLFHIDRAWFEPMLEERFVVADRLVIWTPAHEHVFYMLTKKRRSSEQPALAPMELETGAARA
jgi:SAM-dependent methyltransferase